jgi:rod shape-determining protein MreC
MPLGMLDRTPPPFFRQGPSALTRLVFFAALSIFLMVADTRFKLTERPRKAIATALQPVERVLRVPVDAWITGRTYLVGLHEAVQAESAARQALVQQALGAAAVEPLTLENRQLRELLSLRAGVKVRSVASEVLYDAPDPFSRKVIIDRGTQHGIVLASPVINELGVLGQVTRVYPHTAEVTLLTDKEAAIPVLNNRTQARSAAFGNSAGAGMELRFMAGNADVQVDDALSTSGVDGIYPPGLPVAKVVTIDRHVDAGFARITLAPLAEPDHVRHVLVLEPVGLQMPVKPEPEPPPVVVKPVKPKSTKPAKPTKKGAHA